jgi:DNA-binding HxlR family transcriptional regulator
MNYGQFCPISKASEILGERWTILILRELNMGAHRFSELQRGLGDISPALLAARLKSFEEQGLVAKRRAPGQRSHEYWPTRACSELMPVLVAIGNWGMLYTRDTVLDDEIDPEMLMLYLERSIDPAELVGEETVIQFKFTDLREQQNWWLLVRQGKVDLCITDPGKDVNVYFCSTLRTMHDVWMGDRSWREAMASGDLLVEGERALLLAA